MYQISVHFHRDITNLSLLLFASVCCEEKKSIRKRGKDFYKKKGILIIVGVLVINARLHT